MSAVRRFLSRVDRSGECWTWTARTDKDGYGAIDIDGDKKAHRLAYELAFDIAPGDRLVCHRCDNPRCVNPAHLFLGDNAINTADRNAKGRQARGPRVNHAKLETVDVESIWTDLARGIRQVDIAARHGVSQSTVSSIKRRKTWRAPWG